MAKTACDIQCFLFLLSINLEEKRAKQTTINTVDAGGGAKFHIQ